jgi:hypothetical protein
VWDSETCAEGWNWQQLRGFFCFLIAILFGVLLLPLVAVGLIFFGVFALLA